MSNRHLITIGIGQSPGTTHFIVTRGLNYVQKAGFLLTDRDLTLTLRERDYGLALCDRNRNLTLDLHERDE